MPDPALTERELAYLRALRRGQIVTGTVTEIAGFGVTFVDIGGFTAMINIPELSWRPINHPCDVVTVGQQVTAEILDVDVERGRVLLSLKALQEDPPAQPPGTDRPHCHRPSDQGRPFGAFVRIEDTANGLEGLLPRSELASSTVELGDALTVKIAYVDVTRRRIGLALASGSHPTEPGPAR